jgi:predicted flap endonuclease-1-like 5' DNA nuclease
MSQWIWWLIILVIAALIGVLIWWLLTRQPEEEAVPAAKPEPAVAPPSVEAAPDDLKLIEGIGPKIASLLSAAGITTFAQLAEADVGWLKEILEEADLAALADPSTWPEQAKLAAEGAWEKLEALQEELKGGRR